jgi:hypothetical protein
MLEAQREGDRLSSLVAIVEDSLGEARRILGVSIGATEQQLRAAYREKIFQYHPDKVASLGPELKELAEEKTKEINGAYDVLANRPTANRLRQSTTVRYSRAAHDPSGGATTVRRPPSDNMAAILSILVVAIGAAGLIAILVSNERFPAPTESSVPISTATPANSPMHIVSFEPACETGLTFRPKSGAEIGGRHRGGLGRLRVENGTANDAVAVLVDNATLVAKRAIYVRSRETGVVSSIPAGTYRLRFQLGDTWLRQRRFCSAIATSEFNDTFDFREVPSENAIEYSAFEVTLQPVRWGAARTRTLSAADLVLPSQDEQDR